MKALFLFLSLMPGIVFYGQNKKSNKNTVVPPIEVTMAFSKEFPKVNPDWKTDFETIDGDQQRFIANFKVDDTKVSAIYNQIGELKVLEESIKTEKLPEPVLKYLKENYAAYTINEAVKIKKGKNNTSYEVGIDNKKKFFIAQFDKTGYFLQIAEK